MGSAPLRLWQWQRRSQHQDWVALDVTVVHVPLVRQAPVSLERVPRVMSTGVFFWAPAGSLLMLAVRITVFCSAIVIDVIVHCHTAGAPFESKCSNNCPYHRVVGF